MNYIAQDNRSAAIDVAERIIETAARLEQHPFMGRLKAIRELTVPGLPYIFRHRISKEAVEILRIHHLAQRWPEEGGCALCVAGMNSNCFSIVARSQ